MTVRLRKIDCVMVRVGDLDAAVDFYAREFGLRPLWRDAVSAGLTMPETDAEVVLHTMPEIPSGAVHYLVDDVRSAVSSTGMPVRTPPFEIEIGWCAVLEDPFGNPVYVLDMTKGPRA